MGGESPLGLTERTCKNVSVRVRQSLGRVAVDSAAPCDERHCPKRLGVRL